MSIPVDGRATFFGYLTEKEQAAWDHGVFQGQLDRELEAWADDQLATGGAFSGETGTEPVEKHPPGCVDPATLGSGS